MKSRAQPVFTVGERVWIRGMHHNYTPTIITFEPDSMGGAKRVTVKTDGLPGSERMFKVSELEKIR